MKETKRKPRQRRPYAVIGQVLVALAVGVIVLEVFSSFSFGKGAWIFVALCLIGATGAWFLDKVGEAKRKKIIIGMVTLGIWILSLVISGGIVFYYLYRLEPMFVTTREVTNIKNLVWTFVAALSTGGMALYLGIAMGWRFWKQRTKYL